MDDERIGQPVGLSSLLLHMSRKAADTQLSRGDITKDEYDEIIKILYPPLRLVDDKKNGGIPSFRSGAATIPYFRPGSTMYKPAPVPYFKELMAAQALLGGTQLMNNAASVGNIPGVTTGDTLDPDEVERKRKERQAALDEARRNKTSAAVADKVRDAADRGEYGDVSFFGQDVRPDGDY